MGRSLEIEKRQVVPKVWGLFLLKELVASGQLMCEAGIGRSLHRLWLGNREAAVMHEAWSLLLT
jgi:hypothetical protein